MGLYLRFGMSPSARGVYQRLGFPAAGQRSWLRKGWDRLSALGRR
jgi:hypothetical protein